MSHMGTAKEPVGTEMSLYELGWICRNLDWPVCAGMSIYELGLVCVCWDAPVDARMGL
jgi:hypothetical protein